MNRTTSITLAVILVVATIGVPLAAASVASNGSVQDDTEAGNESIKPGEQFAAAVGVQNAEVEGDVSERAFGVRIAKAETNETKAAVVAAQYEESEARLAELEDRLEALNELREAGELSEGRYRAEVAKITAEMRTIERQAERAETTAAGLPDEVFADRDVDVDSIRALRDRAGDLGGPDTAAIARSIAGDDVGRSMGDDRASRGPGASGNESRTGGNGTSD